MCAVTITCFSEVGSEGGFQSYFGDPHMHMYDDASYDSNISIPGTVL